MASESGQGQDGVHSRSQRPTMAFNGVAFVPGFSPVPIVGIHPVEHKDSDALLFSGHAETLGRYTIFARDNDGVNAGVLLGAGAGNNKKQEEKAKEKRDRELKEIIFQQLLERYRYIEARIETVQDYQDALGRHLQKLKNGEKIEVNEDGTLKDKKAEEAIRAYEAEYGIRIDRLNEDAVEGVLEAYGTEEVNLRREKEDIKRDHPDFVQKAEEMDGMSKEEVIADIQATQDSRAVNKSVSQMNNIDNKITIVASQGFSHSQEQVALKGATGSLFSKDNTDTLGSENPFAKGDATQAFAAVAPLQQDTLSIEQELQPKSALVLPGNAV